MRGISRHKRSGDAAGCRDLKSYVSERCRVVVLELWGKYYAGTFLCANVFERSDDY